MIARVGLLLGLAAAAVADITVTCGGNGIFVFTVRVGNTPGQYQDYEYRCNGGTVEQGPATIPVMDGQRFIVVNRGRAGVRVTSGAATGANAAAPTNGQCTRLVGVAATPVAQNTAQYCEITSASGAYFLVGTGADSQPNNFLYDCGMITNAVTVGIAYMATSAPSSYDATQQFRCVGTQTTAPTTATIASFPTASGYTVFTIADRTTSNSYFTSVINGNTATLIGINNAIFGAFMTQPTSMCNLANPMLMCKFEDGQAAAGAPSSFDFTARALVVADTNSATGNNGVNSFCAYTCQSFGASGATGTCNPNPAAQAAAPAYCRAGSTAVVVQDCPAGQTTGGVVQCIGGGVQQVGQAEINSVFALIAAGRNPRLAFNSFIDALRAQGYGVATAAVCAPCQAQVLANGGGGFVACASCVVVNAQAGVQTRRQVVAANPNGAVSGVAVVVCPQVGAAAQTECLRAASCAGVFAAGATCSIGGAGAACPVCLNAPRFEEESSSKKGLLGLLGLLALIPLCLLLLSSCLLCCLLLRRKKRAVLVPPPVMPTVAPMTSVCEPAVVCGGTAAYPATAGYPGACSPYGGSAYPCV